jgi:ankyrin repeat protein
MWTRYECGGRSELRWRDLLALELGPQHSEALDGHLAVVKTLVLELGADKEAAAAKGWTPLHPAARQGQVAGSGDHVARVGAYVGALSGSGATPLQPSVDSGQHQVAQAPRELERSARTKKEAAAKKAAEAAEAAVRPRPRRPRSRP